MDQIDKHLEINETNTSITVNLTTNHFQVTRDENDISMLHLSDGNTVKYDIGGIDGKQICLYMIGHELHGYIIWSVNGTCIKTVAKYKELCKNEQSFFIDIIARNDPGYVSYIMATFI